MITETEENKFIRFLKRLYIRKTVELVWGVSKSLTIISILIIILENGAWAGSIYMLKILVNIASNPNDEHLFSLTGALIFTGLISILYVIIKSISGYYSELQATKVNQHIDGLIHNYIHRLDYTYYEDARYFDTLKRACDAANGRPFAVVKSLFDMGRNLLTLVTVAYLLISISVFLLPLLTILVIPIFIGKIINSNKSFELYIKNTELDREVGYLGSLLTGEYAAKEVRAFGLGDFIFKKYIGLRNHLVDQNLKLSKKRAISDLINTGVGTIGFFGVTAFIVYGAMNGTNTVGDIALFLVIFPQAFSVMQGLFGAVNTMYQNNMHVHLIFDLFEYESPIEHSTSKAEFKEGGLVLRNVNFEYPNKKETILEGINMEIPQGKIVAIVGINGAGKTTLIKLLCKLYNPTSGTISYKGNDITQYSSTQYRNEVSVVFQDFVKYNLTIKENIAFGDLNKEATEEHIKEAASYAGAVDFIEKLPKKYDTVLGHIFENGHEISVGQWQKIAIARAFFSKSKLLIFDEASSALDTLSESQLFHSFRKNIKDRSALIISHRLSTIQHADYIYVLSDKTIAEEGTHQQLLEQSGIYASLFKTNNG